MDSLSQHGKLSLHSWVKAVSEMGDHFICCGAGMSE